MNFRDKDYSPQEGVSLWETCPILAIHADPYMGWVFVEEFWSLDMAVAAAGTGLWNATVSDALGTTGMTDAAHGIFGTQATAVDNNETYISSQAETFLPIATKPMWFEAKLSLAEANVDDANWIIGLSSVVAADTLQNNGDGPPANYDGIVCFKVDGTMTIQTETSAGAAQVTTAAAAVFTSATWYRVGFFFDGGAATNNVIFYVNGAVVATHSLAVAGLTEMHAVFGVKAGGGNAELLLTDYIKIAGVR